MQKEVGLGAIHTRSELKISEHKALYYTEEFKDLLKKYPELIKGITQIVETTQHWLSKPESENDPFDASASLTYSDNLRVDFIGAKSEDKYGDYKHKQVVYLEIHVAGQDYFLKAAPGNYHSGGVTEALATNFLKEEIINRKIQGVEVIDCIAAYQSGQNKYYVSPLNNPNKLYSLEGIIETRNSGSFYGLSGRIIPSVKNRVYQVMEIMKAHRMLDSASDHNMFYNLEKDLVLVFDVNPPATIQ